MKQAIKIIEKCKPSYLIFLLWVILTIYHGIMLFIGQLTTDGNIKVFKMQELKEQLEIENNLLENEIAFKSSLRYTKEKAIEKGFQPTASVDYLGLDKN